MYCVFDTERIKGNQIYLLAYQLYDDDFKLVETATYQDTSISLVSRKSPKRKACELNGASIKVDSFTRLYGEVWGKFAQGLVVVFSTTDIGVIKGNCKAAGIEYHKLQVLDLQKILFERSTDAKHKSNLKDFCRQHQIKHSPHIPESDCEATFAAYRVLLGELGEDYLRARIQTL